MNDNFVCNFKVANFISIQINKHSLPPGGHIEYTPTTATIEYDAAMHVKVQQQQLINRQQFVVSALMAFPLIYACTINVFMAFKRVAQTIINCIMLIHH